MYTADYTAIQPNCLAGKTIALCIVTDFDFDLDRFSFSIRVSRRNIANSAISPHTRRMLLQPTPSGRRDTVISD